MTSSHKLRSRLAFSMRHRVLLPPNLPINLVQNIKKEDKGPEVLLLALKVNVYYLSLFTGVLHHTGLLCHKGQSVDYKKNRQNISYMLKKNGLFSPRLLLKVIEHTHISGGIVKFGLQALSPEIHYALTGSNTEGIRDRKEKKCFCLQQTLRMSKDDKAKNQSRYTLQTSRLIP